MTGLPGARSFRLEDKGSDVDKLSIDPSLANSLLLSHRLLQPIAHHAYHAAADARGGDKAASLERGESISVQTASSASSMQPSLTNSLAAATGRRRRAQLRPLRYGSPAADPCADGLSEPDSDAPSVECQSMSNASPLLDRPGAIQNVARGLRVAGMRLIERRESAPAALLTSCFKDLQAVISE